MAQREHFEVKSGARPHDAAERHQKRDQQGCHRKRAYPSPPTTSTAAIRTEFSEGTASTKTRLTLRIDADLFREARAVAAEEGRTIGALLTDLLAGLVRHPKAFYRARRRAR